MRKILLAVVVVVLFVGCIGGEEALDLQKETGGEEEPSTSTSEESISERKVITTSQIEIETGNFEITLEKIEKIIEKYEGYIAQSSSETEENYKEGYVTLRIPEKHFSQVVEEIKLLGTVKSTDIRREDVTKQYIDLESRLKNRKAEEQRYLEILEKADTVEEILKIESRLSDTREAIERIQGEMNYLKNRVEYSTITIRISEPKPISYEWGLKGALETGIQAFMATIRAIIIGFFITVPVAAMAAILYGAYKFVKKKTGFSLRRKPKE